MDVRDWNESAAQQMETHHHSVHKHTHSYVKPSTNKMTRFNSTQVKLNGVSQGPQTLRTAVDFKQQNSNLTKCP